MVNIDEFLSIDLRVGKIIGVEEHEKARKPMYKLTVSLGEEMGERTIVAGIRDRYTKDELMGKFIICVTNLEPKEIAGVQSQGMLLAAEDETQLSLLTPDKEIKAGSRVH